MGSFGGLPTDRAGPSRGRGHSSIVTDRFVRASGCAATNARNCARALGRPAFAPMAQWLRVILPSSPAAFLISAAVSLSGLIPMVRTIHNNDGTVFDQIALEVIERIIF